MQFEFATAARIVFGAGTIQKLASIAQEFGERVVLVYTNEERAAVVLEQLSDFVVYPIQIQKEPTLDFMQKALEEIRPFRANFVIGFGGGSAIDAGKALAALLTNLGHPLEYLEVIGQGKPLSQPPIPYIAIPTTAGTGAEVTKNAVLGSTEHEVKVSLRHPLMLPKVALIDPELTLTLPPHITAFTGMDALTQLIESFTTPLANPITDAFCRDGIPRVGRSLQIAYQHGDDLSARTDMALGSLLGGLALANAKLGAVHGFAGVFGGMFDAPHGAICAQLLPYTTQTNIQAMRQREPANPALGCYNEVACLVLDNRYATADDLITWLFALAEDFKIPGLRSYGFGKYDFPLLIERSAQSSSMKGNPIRLNTEEMEEILKGAL